MKWELIDYTVPKGGYLQLRCDGQRVCDFFPFARGSDEQWVRDQARHILAIMNGAKAPLVLSHGAKNPAPDAAPGTGVPGKIGVC